MLTALHVCRARVQGRKTQIGITEGKKRWVAGAPNSKCYKYVRKNPLPGERLQTVPLPTTVAEINDPHMATFFENGEAAIDCPDVD